MFLNEEGEMNRCTSVCAPSEAQALYQATLLTQLQGCCSLLCSVKTGPCSVELLLVSFFCRTAACVSRVNVGIS